MLSKPELSKCSDRQSMPKKHPTGGSPEEWFRNEQLSENNLLGISFDFFINWSATPFSLTPEIWIKRILETPYEYSDVLDNLQNIMATEFGLQYLTRLRDFSSLHLLTTRFIIFRDDYDWKNQTSSILIITLTSNNLSDLQYNAEIISIADFKKLIQQHSGGPIQIGSKGLIYGTSNLECFLSRTDSLYPGDVDLILLDSQNLPVAIIEFKKHTLSSSIDGQKLSNYYPFPDKRKYDRLAILRDYLSRPNFTIPIIVIYYPTASASTEGIMELIGGSAGELHSLETFKFLLPVNQSKEQEASIIKKGIEIIEKYKSI
ncbi:hypothetical protein LQ567_16515 [Niabella pedocola]|uniref:NERD domain-containing protein n=1 Tax=Niabella pedocola TaxID=1752077 RepID=A0ABS8PTI6_9BACT|nr:hypothetical protein [Niabella pedocola]MCD2424385.1 hypothetical protein [Niabella pedocola]